MDEVFPVQIGRRVILGSFNGSQLFRRRNLTHLSEQHEPPIEESPSKNYKDDSTDDDSHQTPTS